MVKSEGTVTTSVTLVVWLRAPLVAVMVMGYEPVGVLLTVLMVRVVEPEVVTWVGLNPAVAPPGSPLAVKLTVPLNPFKAVTFTV
jgi:hypothetical protein